jgi:hypothetical protein
MSGVSEVFLRHATLFAQSEDDDASEGVMRLESDVPDDCDGITSKV